jgi:hypothetical protein
MSDHARHVAQGVCTCVRCALTSCGALPADWPDWWEIELCGDARVILFRLTDRFPLVWPEAKRLWAGEVDWFRRLGLALDVVGGDDAVC